MISTTASAISGASPSVAHEIRTSARTPAFSRGAPGQFRIFRRDPRSLREIRHALHLRALCHAEHYTNRRARVLGICELANGHDIRTCLFDPVPSRDPRDRTSHTTHVLRDLLRPQYPNLVDSRVVDARPVVDIRAPLHRQIGIREEAPRLSAFKEPFGRTSLSTGAPMTGCSAHSTRPHTPWASAPRTSASGRSGVCGRRELRQDVEHLEGGYGGLVLPDWTDREPSPTSACSTVSVVSTPNTTGTPVSRFTRCSPRRTFTGDEVEMRSFTADHGSKTYDSLSFPLGDRSLCCEWKLECQGPRRR